MLSSSAGSMFGRSCPFLRTCHAAFTRVGASIRPSAAFITRSSLIQRMTAGVMRIFFPRSEIFCFRPIDSLPCPSCTLLADVRHSTGTVASRYAPATKNQPPEGRVPAGPEATRRGHPRQSLARRRGRHFPVGCARGRGHPRVPSCPNPRAVRSPARGARRLPPSDRGRRPPTYRK